MTSSELPNTAAADQREMASLAEAARRSAASNQIPAAADLYRRLLQRDPAHSEALSFLGMQALAAGDLSQSLVLFERAVVAHPEDAALFKNLGLVQRARGALPEAVAALDAALHLQPEFPIAHLHKGAVLEQLGRSDEALNSFLAGLMQAGDLGLMVQPERLPAGLRQALQHAMDVVQQAREVRLAQALAPLRAGHPAADFARVDQCLRVYFRQEALPAGNPLQRCTFMTFPGVPSQAWFERAQFPWFAEIEKHTAEIRGELLEVLRGDEGFRPFIELRRHLPGAKYWEALNYSPNWNAFFFYRDGRRFDANCARCPVTAGLLDTLPLSRVAEHSPETLFSVLKPGAHIPPHTGVINIRLVAHLALIIPPDCGIRVGTEIRGWKEGECIVFDDTFEHEAWNKSAHTRVVLIFDIWNPYLSEVEREAMRIVVEELGRLGRVSGRQDRQD
ncbi:MAG TPA: aspartyl/asparaginyl beta-hydroxylase domain-containing protein [Gammaproteobacteria bacterium]|nr:aspartyl/asparaginyl beta-hydroxylase domain-containing protein [Gammaproteobacteria bacterium]